MITKLLYVRQQKTNIIKHKCKVQGKS